jgi:hypothetical protein
MKRKILGSFTTTIKIKLLENIGKKIHKRGYVKSLAMIQFFIPKFKVITPEIPKNIENIEKLIFIEHLRLKNLKTAIKDYIIKNSVKVRTV